MTVTIRPATPDDADAIATIIALALGDEVASKPIQIIIDEVNHISFVAVIGESVIGFVDGFLTIAQDRTQRWELDLLGVHPNYRGRGAGKKLIETFTKAGTAQGATLARALVAVDNKPMQAAMTQTGYQKQDGEYALYISSANGDDTSKPSQSHFIFVNTFTYRGIWIEGENSAEAIDYANAIRENYGWDIIGVVVSKTDIVALDTIRKAEFDFVKMFDWWYQAI